LLCLFFTLLLRVDCPVEAEEVLEVHLESVSHFLFFVSICLAYLEIITLANTSGLAHPIAASTPVVTFTTLSALHLQLNNESGVYYVTGRKESEKYENKK
jgi:hypothetical protein